ncbi:hypothetical protein C8J47_0152, partial [Sphingomonas sp. PP-F2F-G114-C0414]
MKTRTETNLAKINEAKADIVDAIENGRYNETLMDRMLAGESLEG